MRILSHVCAEFRNAHGLIIFQVQVCEKNAVVEAPEEIRSDPLFGMLIAEGSLEIVKSEAQQKELENDPIKGTDATGKRKNTKKETAVSEAVPGDVPQEVPGSETVTTSGVSATKPVSGKIKSNTKAATDEAVT